MLTAPFSEARVEQNYLASVQLVIPPMVADAVYRDAIAEDCRQFQDTIAKYTKQLGTGQVQDLVSSPLPYSMKGSYEAEAVFPEQQTFSLQENGEIIIKHQGLSLALDWAEADLLQGVLNPLDGVRMEKSLSVIKLKFFRRDLFCSFLNKKLKIKTDANLFWKVAETDQMKSQRNLELLFREVNPVLSLERGDKLTAALVGRSIHLITGNPEFHANLKFKSVDYIWNLLFESENSLAKSALWNTTGNGVYLQSKPAVIELSGLQ